MAPDGESPINVKLINPPEQHACTSQKILTDIQIAQVKTSEGLIHMGVCFEELTAQIQEQNKNLQMFVESINERMTSLEISQNKQHKCVKDTIIISLSADVTNLKIEIASLKNRLKGENKWSERLWIMGSSFIVAIVVIMATWFMKGGAIN